MFKDMYTKGEYIKKNPTLDVEHSMWKANKIVLMMKRNNIAPKTICEVGCGAGEILSQLQYRMSPECKFSGYEISPQAFKMCKKRANERLNFKLKDFLQEKDVFYDLILLIDLIEHLEDYLGFLSKIKSKSKYKILHIPLDISILTVLLSKPIMKARSRVGHIHYFTKEIALQILRDIGYKVYDYFYTAGSVELPAQSIKSSLARLPRRFLFTVNKDLAVRIMGGYSMMVLAK